MAEQTHQWLCQQIVDNTGDAIIFGDAEGTVRLWNTGAEKMFGFRSEEIVGKSMDFIIPEKSQGTALGGVRSDDENRTNPV
ncbi:MAG: PAS domain S-box protein [Candidatus Binataceae bacterium]